MITWRTWRRPNRGGKVVVAAVCAIVLAALVGAVALARNQGSEPAKSAQQAAASGQSRADHSVAAAATAASPPEAALRLQALLGQHSVLSAEMMRGRLRGDPDFAQAANAAVGKNTEDLGKLVGGFFGQQAQDQFTSIWSTHVAALFNYARGLVDHDDALRAETRASLAAYEGNIADFLSKASKGRLPRNAVETTLRTHVDHLLAQADAYAAQDYTRSDALYREAYAHTYGLGKTLAVGLFGPSLSATLDSPKWRLRSELSKLLGEHLALVVAVMRSAAVNGKDFGAAGQAVNGNTRDLAGAIDSLFGPAAAKGFQTLWADHIDRLSDYASGIAGQDARKRTAALTQLTAFEHRFASFLATATGGRLASPTLAEAFLMHDRMLVQQVDAYAAKDYQKAHDITYSAYQQMGDLAAPLADAIGATVSTKLPKGGTQTGEGGMAGVVEHR